jgi:hypothetical protein
MDRGIHNHCPAGVGNEKLLLCISTTLGRHKQNIKAKLYILALMETE